MYFLRLLMFVNVVYSEPIYRYQLRGMFNNEKNKFINNSVRLISDSIISEVITNAKSNITTTIFDFSCNKQIKNRINKIKIAESNLYLSLNPNLTLDDNRIDIYTNQIIQQFTQKCNNNYGSNNLHYPSYLSRQNIITYDEGGVNAIIKNKYPNLYDYDKLLDLYKISENTIIDKIINRLVTTFIDIDIKYINDSLDCCCYYVIRW